MRELMLIVTGVPRELKAHAADGDAARLRLPWQRLDATVADVRRALLLQLGRPDLAALSPAALIAQAQSAAPGTASWLLSPLHCVAGLDRLHLEPAGLLELPAEQWAGLCASFTRELGDAALTLAPLDGSTALLQGATWDELVAIEPAELPGADLRACQPHGAAAGRWRALQGEIEMWLHEHAVNRDRVRAGLPPVTTLWLWGGGRIAGAPVAAPPPIEAPAGQVLVGMGAWARAVAALQAGVTAVGSADAQDFASLAAAHPGSAASVCVSAAQDPAAIERRWLAPAAQAFARGELDGVSLRHRGVAWRLGRPRWWRRRRHDLGLFDLLAASPMAAVAR